MITDTVRELLTKYIHLCSWFLIREGDQSISTDQFEAVLNEIGGLETQLLENRVSPKAIDRVISYLQRNIPTNKPIGDMTPDQQLKICQAIFGEEIHFEE